MVRQANANARIAERPKGLQRRNQLHTVEPHFALRVVECVQASQVVAVEPYNELPRHRNVVCRLQSRCLGVTGEPSERPLRRSLNGCTSSQGAAA